MSVSAIAVYRAPSSEPAPLSKARIGPARASTRHLSLAALPSQLVLDGFEAPHRLAIPPGRTVPMGADASAGGLPSSRLPDITAFAHNYCRSAAEALTGFRPIEQLRRNSTLGIMEWLRQYAIPIARRRRAAPAPTVKSVSVCIPTEGVAEVSAVIQRGPRVRAMTARFVEMNDQWKCVHLQVI